MKCIEVKLSVVMILGEMCVLSLIYSYVAVRTFYAVGYIIIACFLYFLCTVAPFMLSLSCFCTSLPTTATGWTHSCSNKISYHTLLT